MSTQSEFPQVVLVGDEGYVILRPGKAVHPEQFHTVYIPAQRADETRVEVLPADLREVGGSEREMGEETLYSAEYEEFDSETKTTYRIQVDFFEYPTGNLQYTDDAITTQNMRFVEIGGLDSLLSRITS